MINALTIHIKKRNQRQWIIFVIVCISLFMNCLIQFLHFPSFLKYSADLCWALLLFYIIKSNKRRTKNYRTIRFFVIVFFAYCAVSYLFNYQSVFYFLWGTRNLFRMYIFFLSCILFLDNYNIISYFKIFDIVFIVNAVVTLVQYFVLGYHQDYLSGIFGTEAGGNGYINIFFCIVTIICTIKLFQKEISTFKAILYFCIMLFLAALAELKAFYIEFIIILSVSFLITGFSFKRLFIVVGAFAFVLISINFLIELYPIFKDTFSVEGLLKSTASDSGYTGSGDLNRLNVITQVNKRFLKTPIEHLFGLGLGNCDYSSSFELLTTPFYNKNFNSHYTWISYAFIYLETGLIGLALYFSVYVASFIQMIIKLNKHKGKRTYVLISLVTAIIGVFISIYNSSLRTEAGYIFYLVLSFGYIDEFTNKANCKNVKYNILK